jgi:hypothetical protein
MVKYSFAVHGRSGPRSFAGVNSTLNGAGDGFTRGYGGKIAIFNGVGWIDAADTLANS